METCKAAMAKISQREYLKIIEGYFSCFILKPYVVTPCLNHLDETVQMRGHNICFYAELTKIISDYHPMLPLILSSDFCFLATITLQNTVSCPNVHCHRNKKLDKMLPCLQQLLPVLRKTIPELHLMIIFLIYHQNHMLWPFI